jgi:hypothetical protein
MWWGWRTELRWAALPRLHWPRRARQVPSEGKGVAGGEDAELTTQRCEHVTEFY